MLGIPAMRRATAIAACGALVCLSGWGQAPTPLGGEFQVNSYTTGGQYFPKVATGADGDFAVVWLSTSSQDGNLRGVFGQRYDSAGSRRGAEFQVNSYTTGDQWFPALAMDSDGDFVVVWVSDSQDGDETGVFGQRFDSAGSRRGAEFQVNSYTTRWQNAASVAMDADGDFVVVWYSHLQDGSQSGIFGQQFESGGARLGGEFRVNTYTTDTQSEPTVAANASGSFVVVWRSRHDAPGSEYGIFGQRFDSAGSKRGEEFSVNSYTTGSQVGAAAALESDGDFLVVWYSWLQDGDGNGIFGQRFDSGGARLGAELQINSYTTGGQSGPAVAASSAGGFVVIWKSDAQDGDSSGGFGRRYELSGTRVGGEFQINAYTTWSQLPRSVALDSDGDFVVTWRSFTQDGSADGVFGRRFSVFERGTAIASKRACPAESGEIFAFTGDLFGSLEAGEALEAQLPPGEYSTAELASAGWELATIECDDPESSADVGTGTATYRLQAGERVECVFTNLAQPLLPAAGVWTSFEWTDGPGVFDDEGAFCFIAEAPGSLDVTDVDARGDRFEAYDAGSPVGQTSVPLPSPDPWTTADPDVAFSDARYSSGSFPLWLGCHCIEIKTIAVSSTSPSGRGYLRWVADDSFIFADGFESGDTAAWSHSAGEP
jgi:hypothetical protein